MSEETAHREHHDSLPPSSFPALDQCPSYRPGEARGEAVSRGNILHDQFAILLKEQEDKRCQSQK